MTLIPCLKCKCQVSSYAEKCPHCGHSSNNYQLSGQEIKNIPKLIDLNDEIKPPKKSYWNTAVIIALVFGLATYLKSISGYFNEKSEKVESEAEFNEAPESSIKKIGDTDSFEIESIDGVYTGSTYVSGVKLNAGIVINGNQWTAESQLEYDQVEYYTGIVKGKELYDESGFVKVGYVSGNSVHMNGYPTMRK